ncbi:DUF1772 domain-containing protein [Catenulispora yoronensis]|uniref:DUF1772 domain-containing protein n=1 Tax=Catenulispora yoronensis TaxID=450799 RepID=A0ABP5FV25_9ACTN
MTADYSPAKHTGTRGAATILASATIVMGLIAGVYYAFACAVMLGLGASGDRTFIEAMQNINTKIENPLFFLSFFGALVLPAWALRKYRHDRRMRLWIAAALGLYVIGLLTTMGINIPLNNDLAAAGNPAKIADPAAVRAHFENTWNTWNIARALLSTGAAACLARAMMLLGKAEPEQRLYPPVDSGPLLVGGST